MLAHIESFFKMTMFPLFMDTVQEIVDKGEKVVIFFFSCNLVLRLHSQDSVT